MIKIYQPIQKKNPMYKKTCNFVIRKNIDKKNCKVIEVAVIGKAVMINKVDVIINNVLVIGKVINRCNRGVAISNVIISNVVIKVCQSDVFIYLPSINL